SLTSKRHRIRARRQRELFLRVLVSRLRSWRDVEKKRCTVSDREIRSSPFSFLHIYCIPLPFRARRLFASNALRLVWKAIGACVTAHHFIFCQRSSSAPLRGSEDR
ncbi:unnamed protein product, partial [Ixodes persulcatus]